MAVELVSDIAGGSNYRSSLNDGDTAVRVYKISGIPADMAFRQSRAERELASRGVFVGAVVSGVSQRLICADVLVEPWARRSTTIFRATTAWRSNGITSRLATTTMSEETSLDHAGELLKVRCDNDLDDAQFYIRKQPSRGSWGWRKAPVFRPSTIAEFRRFELNAEYKPKQAIEYVGALNSGEWQGDPPHTWLCVGVETVWYASQSLVKAPPNVQAAHETRYMFLRMLHKLGRDYANHNKVILYRDPFSDTVPPRINPQAEGYPRKNAGNGWKVVRLQPEMDFGPLRLPEIPGRR